MNKQDIYEVASCNYKGRTHDLIYEYNALYHHIRPRSNSLTSRLAIQAIYATDLKHYK